MIATMAESGDGPLTQRPTGRPLSRNRALRRSPTESERPRGRPGDRPPSRLFVFRSHFAAQVPAPEQAELASWVHFAPRRQLTWQLAGPPPGQSAVQTEPSSQFMVQPPPD